MNRLLAWHRVLALVGLLAAATWLTAQGADFPYALSRRVDVPLAVPIVGLNATWPLIDGRVYRLSPDYLANLRADDIRPRCDRAATRQWSISAQKTSDVLLYAALATPATLAFSAKNRHWRAGGTVATMGLESAFLTLGLTQVIKNTAQRERPFVYNSTVPNALKYQSDARRSFFSGHTSMSATACFFTAQVYSDLYPESRWRPVVWGAAATLPAVAGYFRYRGGKHFPTDILAGYAVGALSGWLVPRLHRRRF
jgi:membrane-associated phospholipid phosphatase